MKKNIIIIIILIIVLVIINLIPGLTKGLGNFVYKIFSPFDRLFTDAGSKIIGFFEVVASIGDLNKENVALREENVRLNAEIISLKEVWRENDVLRQALSISKPEQRIVEIATITGKDMQGVQDWILINRGTKHGITKDMAVVSPQYTLIGIVAETGPAFSKVMLITQKESVVAGLIEDSRADGLIKRDEKGGLFMDFIPNNENLKIGEKIITSGMDNLYPRGILVGEIENIDPSENQIFQKIIIAPATNFLKLEQVFIVK